MVVGRADGLGLPREYDPLAEGRRGLLPATYAPGLSGEASSSRVALGSATTGVCRTARSQRVARGACDY